MNDWKKSFFTDSKKKIASIPFLRNLVEYTKGETDPNFTKLTSLLHWKSDTLTITDAELNAIYVAICGTTTAPAGNTTAMVNVIETEANSCMTSGSSSFENKIVLAIATRLAAEKFMVNKIGAPGFVAGITAHQTQALLAKFKAQFPMEFKAIETLERVQLMTPENIHLNSFMYEPIVDMSAEHLRKLYGDVRSLK